MAKTIPLTRLPRELGDWRINRNETQIIFGCGEVKILKKHLQTLVSPQVQQALKYLQTKRIKDARVPHINTILNVGPEVLKGIIG